VAAPLFRCPACEAPLHLDGGRYRCSAGHSFDVAREGYVNLLLAQHRHSTDPGYSKEMIAGRRDFFDAGHYQTLADRVADIVAAYLPAAREPVLIDAGCGEGYYLRRLRRRLAAADGRDDVVLCGIDISKHGIRVAAKRDPTGLYAVAGTHRMPVVANRADVVLTHFSPISASDFRRVVRPGGTVVVGGPGEDHLFALKQLLYDVATQHSPARHQPTRSLTPEAGFEPVASERIRYPLRLRGRGQVANLLLMTPFYWSVGQQIRSRLAALDELDTEVDVVLKAYRVVR